MTPQRLAGLIENLPEGLTEIYMHPAIAPYPGSAPGYLYGEELAALTEPGLPGLIRAKGISVGGYGDFHPNKINGLT
jgi:hypothetical protein